MRLTAAIVAVVVTVSVPSSVRSEACEPIGASPFDPPALNAGGSVVAFATNANLVPADTNRTLDVYAVDLATGAPELISVRSDGTAGDRRASRPSVSDDGRFVAFESDASGVTPGDDDHGQTDVFVRDRVAGTTTLVSATPDGNIGTGGSSRPDISPDGTLVAFQSTAADLAPDANTLVDVFVRDRTAGTTVRISEPTGAPPSNLGSYAPSISGTGRVAFETTEDFGQTSRDLNVREQVREGGNYDRNVVVHDMTTATTHMLTAVQDGLAYSPDISADGTRVAFESSSTDLVAGDTNNHPGPRGLYQPDVFVRDVDAGTTTRVSVDGSGGQADGDGSAAASISGDGTKVAFESGATNLVPGDTNGAIDVFVHMPGTTSRASVTASGEDPGSAGDLSFGSVSPAISSDGTAVAFVGSAPGLTGRDDGAFGVFVRTPDGLAGPFGIGCRTEPDGAPPPIAFRDGLAPIQPGGAIMPEPPGSMNFVFRDRTSLYIGTAAHVVREVNIGDSVTIPGYGEFGRLVYAREGSNAFSRQDFALVEIDPDRYGDVNPAVRSWGGPTAVAEPGTLAPGLPTFQFGQGFAFRHAQGTRAKLGVLEGRIDHGWGYQGWYLHANHSFAGDSGSGVLSGPDGDALGVTIGLAAGFGEPGLWMGPTIRLVLQELRLAGFDVELVTAPFGGPAAAAGTLVSQCIAKPVETGPQNDGCVRPSTSP